jgi:hypothetical protein
MQSSLNFIQFPRISHLMPIYFISVSSLSMMAYPSEYVQAFSILPLTDGRLLRFPMDYRLIMRKIHKNSFYRLFIDALVISLHPKGPILFLTSLNNHYSKRGELDCSN